MAPWAWVASMLAGGWLYNRLMQPAWTPTLTRTDPHGHRTPPGPEVLAEHQPLQWPATPAGRTSFVKATVQKLVELSLLSGPSLALFVAHMARETGWGHSVYNHNFGNEKQFGNGPWMRLADHEPYMSFPTFEAGLTHNVQRVARQWPGPWHKLLAGDSSWYGDLGLAGYYEYQPPTDPVTGIRPPPRRHTPETIGPTQREYDSMVRTVRTLLGNP